MTKRWYLSAEKARLVLPSTTVWGAQGDRPWCGVHARERGCHRGFALSNWRDLTNSSKRRGVPALGPRWAALFPVNPSWLRSSSVCSVSSPAAGGGLQKDSMW